MFARIALRVKMVALPDPDVESHKAVMPLLGGAAILCGLLPTLAVCVGTDFRWLGLVLGLIIMAALGVSKDHPNHQVPTKVQLALQSAAVVFVLIATASMQGARWEMWQVCPALVLCLWMVNGWNFMDIMDGLASGLTSISAIVFVAIHAIAGNPSEALLAAALSGASLGFLIHNAPPAKVFMGDTGSYSIGLTFCALVLRGQAHTGHVPGAWLVLALPMFEVLWVSCIRTFHGRSPFIGEAGDHTVYKLAARGWHCKSIVAVASLAATVLGAGGMALAR